MELAEMANFEANELARLCLSCTRQLQRKFRHQFGRTPQSWLNERRMMSARQRLLAGEPVKKVAFDLGFKQVSHFYRQFKSLNHMTTSEFLSMMMTAAAASLGDTNCRSRI